MMNTAKENDMTKDKFTFVQTAIDLLRKQGTFSGEKVESLVAGGTGLYVCKYNGPNDTHCIVGGMIPQDMRTLAIEGQNAWAQLDELLSYFRKEWGVEVSLMQRMQQYVHDKPAEKQAAQGGTFEALLAEGIAKFIKVHPEFEGRLV